MAEEKILPLINKQKLDSVLDHIVGCEILDKFDKDEMRSLSGDLKDNVYGYRGLTLKEISDLVSDLHNWSEDTNWWKSATDMKVRALEKLITKVTH